MDRMSEKIIQLTASVLIRMFNTGAQFSTTIQRLHSRSDKHQDVLGKYLDTRRSSNYNF